MPDLTGVELQQEWRQMQQQQTPELREATARAFTRLLGGCVNPSPAEIQSLMYVAKGLAQAGASS